VPSYIAVMTTLSPSERTAGTARIVLAAGALVALEALWRGSVARTLLASLLLALGGGLLLFAKRAD
jgi:hypothetical protein